MRTGDIIGNNRDDTPAMKWEHLDLRTHLWTIPKTKTNAMLLGGLGVPSGKWLEFGVARSPIT